MKTLAFTCFYLTRPLLHQQSVPFYLKSVKSFWVPRMDHLFIHRHSTRIEKEVNFELSKAKIAMVMPILSYFGSPQKKGSFSLVGEAKQIGEKSDGITQVVLYLLSTLAAYSKWYRLYFLAFPSIDLCLLKRLACTSSSCMPIRYRCEETVGF